MRTYTLQITTEFRVSDDELQTLINGLDHSQDKARRIFLIMDTSGNHHLVDWNFVTDTHYFNERNETPLQPEYMPEHLPEMDMVT